MGKTARATQAQKEKERSWTHWSRVTSIIVVIVATNLGTWVALTHQKQMSVTPESAHTLESQPGVEEPVVPEGILLQQPRSVDGKALIKFWSYGFVLLKNFLEPEAVAAYRPYVQQVVDKYKEEHEKHDAAYNTLRQEEDADLQEQFHRVYNLWEKEPILREFTLSVRLAKLARDLLQCDAVRLYEDQSFFKGVSHAPTSWHDDLVSCPINANFVTIWIPLHNITKAMGGSMNFASMTHIGKFKDLPPQHKFNEETIRKYFEVVNYDTMNVGDITVHHGSLLHSANPNLDPKGQMREAVAIQFFEDGSKLKSKKELQELDPSDIPSTSRWLSRFKPNEVAQCDELPLSYKCPVGKPCN